MRTLLFALAIAVVGLIAGVAYYAHAQQQEQTQDMMGQGMMSPGS